METTPPLWNRKCIYSMSWQRFECLCQELYTQINASGFCPDLLIGVTRGGLAPSVRLCHMFGVKEFGLISIRRNTDAGFYSSRASPQINWMQIESSGNRVLIVDDIVGSGDTLKAAIAVISSRHKVIRTASLVVNKNSKWYPDHFACEVDDWVVFPWERHAGNEQVDLPIVDL